MRSVLDFPAVSPSRITWSLEGNTESFTAETSAETPTAARKGARWRAVLDFDQLTVREAAQMEAFLAYLGGPAGRFRLPTLHRPGTLPAGTVPSAGQTGNVLLAAGYPAGQQFSAGGFIQVGSELKMITAAANADMSGQVNLQIAPAWRNSPGLGAAVVGTSPVAVMRLEENRNSVVRLPGARHGALSIACIEVF